MARYLASRRDAALAVLRAAYSVSLLGLSALPGVAVSSSLGADSRLDQLTTVWIST